MLTINNAADCTFQGVIRNSAQGSGTGKVRLVKNGAGTLVADRQRIPTPADDRQRGDAGSHGFARVSAA